MRRAALVLACWACASHVRRADAIEQALESSHELSRGIKERVTRLFDPANVLPRDSVAYNAAGLTNSLAARGHLTRHSRTLANRRCLSSPHLCAMGGGSASSTAVAGTDEGWERALRLIEIWAADYYGTSTPFQEGPAAASMPGQKTASGPTAGSMPGQTASTGEDNEETARQAYLEAKARIMAEAQGQMPKAATSPTTGEKNEFFTPSPMAAPTAVATAAPTIEPPSAPATGNQDSTGVDTSAPNNGGRWQQAFDLLDEIRMAGMTPDLQSYSAAIQVCEKEDQWELVLQLLGEMRMDGIQPDVPSLSAAISVCQRAGQWERLLPLRREMRLLSGEMVTAPDAKAMQDTPEQKVEDTQEDRREQATQPQEATVEQEAETVEQEAQPQGMPAQASSSDSASFSASIAASDEDGDWERVLTLFEEMRSATVTPDVSTFTAAIAACQSGGQWQRKVSLLEEANIRGMAMLVTAALEERQASKESSVEDVTNQDISVDSAAASPDSGMRVQTQPGSNEQLRGEAASSVQAGQSVQKQPEGMMTDLQSYNAGLLACEKMGDWQGVLKLLDDMRQVAVKPNLVSYSAAILACDEAGQSQRAVSIFEETSLRDWAMAILGREIEEGVVEIPSSPNSHAVVSPSDESVQWQQVLSLIEEKRRAGIALDETSFSAAISACEEGGQWQHALLLLEEMRTAIIKPDVSSLKAALNACEKAGHWLGAVAVMEQMPTKEPAMTGR